MWLDILVPDISATFGKAVENGFIPIQPITEIPDMGVKNAILSDPFDHVWMLH